MINTCQSPARSAAVGSSRRRIRGRLTLVFAGLATAVGAVACSEETALTDPEAAFPTAQSSLDAPMSTLPTELASFKSFDRSDFISREDVERAGGRYRLAVDGVGTVLVREIRAPEASGKECLVHKESLRELARKTYGPGAFQPTWLRMNLYVYPELDLWFCFGLGGGCYILISPA